MARRERLANDAQSTLNGAITDVATTLTVTSATGFSTDGDFRVRVNDEIMLVTGVSGSVFTIERGAESTTNVAHGNGDAICQILTKGGLENWVKENADPYALTVRPPYRIADVNGDLLVDTDFTTFGTFATATISLDGGVLSLRQTTKYGGNQLAIKGRPVPGSTPYEVVACMDTVNGESNNGGLFGICFYDDAGTRITVMLVSGGGDTPEIGVHNMNSETSFSSTVGSSSHDTLTGSTSGKIWLKLEDNGTNLIYSFGHDGLQFEDIATVARGSFFTGSGFPTHYGFYVQNRASNTPVSTNLLAWQE
jgi:hypothetical protein